MDKQPDWVKHEMAQVAKNQIAERSPRATSAKYDRRNHRIVVALNNGCTFAFPPELGQGLADATPSQLAEVELAGRGYGLHWDTLDADLSVPDLLAGIFGSRAWMREMGKRGGVATTEAKAAAARENGRKGGRPRKAA